MKLVFDNKPGYYCDVFQSIAYCLNDCFKEIYKSFDITINPEIEKAVKALSKHVYKERELLEVFFTEKSILKIYFGPVDKLWCCQDDETFLELINELSGDSIKYNAIKDLGKFDADNDDDDGNDVKAKINEYMHNDMKIFELIDNLKEEDDMKWKFIKLLGNSEKWSSEFKAFIHEYLPIYKEVVDKFKKSNDIFNNELKNKLNEYGIEYLDKISGNVVSPFFDIGQFNETYITTSFFNSISCIAKESDDKVFITVGRDFEMTLKHLSGEDEQTQLINTFKNLSDKTRFNILMFILKGEVYSQEIADKFSLSMATVSYHMSYLISVKLIHSEKRGQKTYYVVNRKTIKDLINQLNKLFKLDEV